MTGNDHGVATSISDWPRRNYAWYVVALLTLAYALAILDRVSIALLIAPLQEALKINDMQFGLLQGAAFSMVYSLLGLPVGLFCDRSKRVPILIAGLTLWSVATVACSLATSFEGLFFARMLVGTGESVLVPVSASLIADHFPADVRPKAFGVFTTGASLGTGVALILGGLFLLWADDLVHGIPMLFGGMENWQVVFILCGTPGILLAALMASTVREPRRQEVAGAAGKISMRPLFALLRRHPGAFGCLTLGSVLNLVCVYAMLGWFPAMFIRVHGWTAAEAGWRMGMVGVPINIFAAINSGWVVVWLMRRGQRDAPMLTASACGFAMLCFAAPAALAPSGGLALLFYALHAVFVNWNISATYSGISQITPNEMRGQVMALQTIMQGLVALTAGNFIVGLLTDTVFTGPKGIGPALAVVVGVSGLSAALVLLAGRKAFIRAVEEGGGERINETAREPSASRVLGR
ncbi:MAG: MFS transporter [Sphingobium sp.]